MTPQDEFYRQALELHGTELARFLHGYERDAHRRQELAQELQVALWQSFESFRGECSLRTWVYRVAHNVGAGHVRRSLRDGHALSLDEALDVVD
jgi:RNA polymerase sigma-70 factor (ECF subfamily)